MTCAEFKLEVAAYALGSLEAAERAACDQHLQSAVKHDGCAEALRQANETAVLLAAALQPAAASPSMWAQVEARTRALHAAPSGRGLAQMAGWLVAVLALILIVWLGRDRARLNDELRASDEHSRSQRAECVAQLQRLQKDAELQRQALALLALPGSKLIALAQQGAAATQANVIYHSGEKRAFMLGHNLQAPTGKDYELWMIRGDKKIPAGILHADSTGTLLTSIDPTLLAEGPPDAMAVTLEVTGGRPQPEGPIVLVGKI